METATSFTIESDLLKKFKIFCLEHNTSMHAELNRMIVNTLGQGVPRETGVDAGSNIVKERHTIVR